jgi:hypothetical protein
MFRQMTLDGKVRDTEVRFYMNGFERQRLWQETLNHGLFYMRVRSASYNEKTDQIDVYLDVVAQAFFVSDCEDPETFWCEELARVLLHEHVHSVLNMDVSLKACRAWDFDFIHNKCR